MGQILSTWTTTNQSCGSGFWLGWPTLLLSSVWLETGWKSSPREQKKRYDTLGFYFLLHLTFCSLFLFLLSALCVPVTMCLFLYNDTHYSSYIMPYRHFNFCPLFNVISVIRLFSNPIDSLPSKHKHWILLWSSPEGNRDHLDNVWWWSLISNDFNTKYNRDYQNKSNLVSKKELLDISSLLLKNCQGLLLSDTAVFFVLPEFCWWAWIKNFSYIFTSYYQKHPLECESHIFVKSTIT